MEFKPALCLDLDGTVWITKSGKDFAENLTDHQLNGNIEEVIHKYKAEGFVIAIVSNQGGVAHGFKTINTLIDEIDILYSLFKNYPIDHVIGCPHDPSGSVEPYNHRSLSRKPNIGMLVTLEQSSWEENEIMIDWNNSLFVGDRTEDEQCAMNAGIRFIHINDFINK